MKTELKERREEEENQTDRDQEATEEEPREVIESYEAFLQLETLVHLTVELLYGRGLI